MIVREILMSSLLFLNSNVLSLSTSTRTPNDDAKPLDYELMVKLEKTNGSVNYLFKKDWERELGEPYIDNVVKFKYKSKSDVYITYGNKKHVQPINNKMTDLTSILCNTAGSKSQCKQIANKRPWCCRRVI